MNALAYVLIALAIVAVVLVGVALVARGRSSATPSASIDSSAPKAAVEFDRRADAVSDDEAIAGQTIAGQASAGQATTTIELDHPEPGIGRLARLRGRLAKSNTTLGKSLLALLSRGNLDDAAWDEVEETLLLADLGVASTQELMVRLRTGVRVHDVTTVDAARTLLRAELIAALDPTMDRSLHVDRHRDDDRPSVVLIVGVNGTGKTTTTGKLARLIVADGRTVVLGAADTFRAAASEQLQTWGDRVGAHVVRGPDGSDPAAVAFDAVGTAIERGADAVVIDTAGRLHTKTGLMDELGKVKRVAEKHGPVDEVLLVLDATTGQNGLVQARVFTDVVDVTGVVLTKLDGTAKGGIVVSVQRELGVPVKLVGLGEGPDDLAPFDPETFVDALLAD